MSRPNWKTQLGRIAGMISKFNRGCEEMHEDVSRWNAPGECHALVNEGLEREGWALMDDLFVTYGIRGDGELRDELRARCDHKWLFFAQADHIPPYYFDDDYRIETA